MSWYKKAKLVDKMGGIFDNDSFIKKDLSDENKVLYEELIDEHEYLIDLLMERDGEDQGVIDKINEVQAQIKSLVGKTEEERKENRRRLIEEDRREKRLTEERLEAAKNDPDYQDSIRESIKNWNPNGNGPYTQRYKEAGYITGRGELLDFGHDGQRALDHREITVISDELDGQTDGMIQFMYATNSIRLQSQSKDYIGFDWVTEPTSAQKRIVRSLAGYIFRERGEVTIDAFGDSRSYSNLREMNEGLDW